MTVHTREDLERISRFTRRWYSYAAMSDTKWRKLFVAVNESGWLRSGVIVKFVGSDEPESEPMGWPDQRAFWGPPQWIDTPHFGGPIELRAIEWLLIPRIVLGASCFQTPSVGMLQDFAAIKTALANVGQFPLEETPEGLKIIGYR
jgi:hypothetical protein